MKQSFDIYGLVQLLYSNCTIHNCCVRRLYVSEAKDVVTIPHDWIVCLYLLGCFVFQINIAVSKVDISLIVCNIVLTYIH